MKMEQNRPEIKMPAVIGAGEAMTMSSREIADLVDARHDSVKRTVERLSASEVIACPPLVDVQETGGNNRVYTTQEYRLDKRSSLIVVAQLCPEFTARLVDRWQELEAEKANGGFALPLTYEAALEAHLAKVRENNALMIENRAKDAEISAMQPKVDAYDDLMGADGLYGLQNAGRVLGARPNLFIRWLKQDYLFYQGSALVARMEYRQRGYFEVKTKVIDDKARPETFVTPKGLGYLREKMPASLLIGGRA